MTGSKAAEGTDSYFYIRGDGADTITETAWGDTDKLVFVGVTAEQVSLQRSGDDVTLVIAESAAGAGDGGSIRLVAHFDTAYERGVEQIVFADGVVWTAATMRALVLAQASTAGNDTIVGFATGETLTGGRGNDSLSGGAGNDTYVYNRGDGADTITETSWGGTADRLVLSGVTADQVGLQRSGDDVTLVIAESAAGAGDGGSIRLVAHFDTAYERGVEQIVFADGVVWTAATMRALVLAQASTAGNDTIVGFATGETLTGGRGNDSLSGGAGNDTYVYNRGDGADTITETTWGGTADRLVLNGVTADQVGLQRSGDDVTLVIAESAAGAGDGGSIRLVAHFDTAYERGVEQIVFADGVVWTAATMRALVLAQAATAATISSSASAATTA